MADVRLSVWPPRCFSSIHSSVLTNYEARGPTTRINLVGSHFPACPLLSNRDGSVEPSPKRVAIPASLCSIQELYSCIARVYLTNANQNSPCALRRRKAALREMHQHWPTMQLRRVFWHSYHRAIQCFRSAHGSSCHTSGNLTCSVG